MVKNIVPVLILCISFYGFASEQNMQGTVFSTYQGKQLTPTSTPFLAPQFPQEDLPIIKAWLNDPLHKETIQGELLPLTLAGTKANVFAKHQQLQNILAFQGMPNYSAWNYVFDAGKYVIKFPGIINRIQNLLVYNDPNPDKPTLQDAKGILLGEAIKKITVTYQGVSTIPSYLRAAEAIQKFDLSAFNLPKTYILGIDGSPAPQEVHDGNSVVVQEKIANITPLCKMPFQERRSKLSADKLRQLFILTIYAGLWELENNLLWDQTNDKFVITDFEQPNNSNPKHYYHKFLAKILHQNIPCGIGGICKLFKDTAIQTSEDEINNICDQFANLKDEELVKIGSFNG